MTEVQRLEQEIANKVQLIEQATENITVWKADKKELSKALTVAKNIEKKAVAKPKAKGKAKPKANAKDPEKMTEDEKKLERMIKSDKLRSKAVNEASKEQKRAFALHCMGNMDEQKMLDHEKANEADIIASKNLMFKGLEVNKKNLEKESLMVRLGEKDDEPVAVWDDDDEAEAMMMRQKEEPVVEPVLKKNTGSRHNA